MALPTLRPRMPATRVFLIAALSLGVASQAASQGRDSAVARPVPANDSTPACCTIVRIDSRRLVVTARELASGYTFRFQRKDRRVLAGLKPGQPVWADFTANTVKLAAKSDSACCAIVPAGTP